MNEIYIKLLNTDSKLHLMDGRQVVSLLWFGKRITSTIVKSSYDLNGIYIGLIEGVTDFIQQTTDSRTYRNSSRNKHVSWYTKD